MPKEKLLIGRKDLIDLPDFRLTDIPVKIDTGAYTSAIHASAVRVLKTKEGKKISFNILDTPGREGEKVKFVTSQFTRKKVKSSTGQMELRYVIKTRIKIFNKLIRTEFSLANRTAMRFPILLGRKLLKKRFVVDVAETNLSYNRKIQQHEDRHPVQEPRPVLYAQAYGSSPATGA